MEELQQVSGKTMLTNIHHIIQIAIESFERLSVVAPKASLQVIQNIYGRFDDALYNIYKAEVSTDKEEKMKCLHIAKDALFFQFTSFELLSKNKSITIKQANSILSILREAVEEISKWLTSLRCK